MALGLDELGIEASDKHCLDILDIVYNLMKGTRARQGHLQTDEENRGAIRTQEDLNTNKA
ncbi:MAG: hypothetical protein ACJA0U_000604 [Salibacteraceae bacterium]